MQNAEIQCFMIKIFTNITLQTIENRELYFQVEYDLLEILFPTFHFKERGSCSKVEEYLIAKFLAKEIRRDIIK